MRFDLTDLSLFRHVVEAGSITHGAERAHLALAAASTRIRNMEEALGAPLLVRARQGVTPTQAGRTLLQHARTMLEQAERLREDLGAYAGGLAGQVRVLSNTNALTEFLPEALSAFLAAHPQRQRRSRRAAERRDRRPDRRRRRRHRHRRRHRGCRAAHHLSVPQRPLRAGGGARSSAARKDQDQLRRGAGPRFRRPRPRQRDPALPRHQGQPASAGRCGCACSCAASTRSAGWSSAMSASASCRPPPCGVRQRSMAIKAVDLADPWALRDLTICVRDFAALPPYARQLVEHMRTDCTRVVL